MIIDVNLYMQRTSMGASNIIYHNITVIQCLVKLNQSFIRKNEGTNIT